MYCKNCGQQIDDKATICPYCGVSQGWMPPISDSGSFGWSILGFFLPLVGLILYLVWKDTKPRCSHAAGKGALVSVIVQVVFSILGVLLSTMLGAALLFSL